jgi:hypothetical protein
MSFPQLFQIQAWNAENLPKCFNLHPVWTSSKKATDTKEGGRCGTVLPLLGGMFVFLLSAKEADEHTGGNG